MTMETVAQPRMLDGPLNQSEYNKRLQMCQEVLLHIPGAITARIDRDVSVPGHVNGWSEDRMYGEHTGKIVRVEWVVGDGSVLACEVEPLTPNAYRYIDPIVENRILFSEPWK